MNGAQDSVGMPTDTQIPRSSHSEVAVTPDPISQPSDHPPHRATGPARGHRKSPVLACLLSLLPGIGQVYVGYYKLGFVHNVIFASTIMLLSLQIEGLVPLLGIFLAFFFVYNIVDAGRRAALYNLALEGGQGIELPDEMDVKLPSFGGSVVGGLLLMGLGVVLLSNTLFGRSLDWVEDWWPIAPIVLGAYLVGKAIQERRREIQPDQEIQSSSQGLLPPDGV